MDNCCHDKSTELEELRKQQSKTLWFILAINGVMFCLEFVVGLLAGSSVPNAFPIQEFCQTGLCPVNACQCQVL